MWAPAVEFLQIKVKGVQIKFIFLFVKMDFISVILNAFVYRDAEDLGYFAFKRSLT